MPLTVRPATPAELPAAGEAVRAAYEADGIGDPDGSYLVVVADAAARADDALVLVAVSGHDVLGSVTYARHGSPWAEVCAAGEAEFRMLGVLPAGRGRGVGAALVAACADRARAEGARRLALSADARSAAAHRLYERAGFERRADLDWSPVPGVQLVGYSLDLYGPERLNPPGSPAEPR